MFLQATEAAVDYFTSVSAQTGGKRETLAAGCTYKPEVLSLIIEAKGQWKGSWSSQERVKYSQEVDKCQL